MAQRAHGPDSQWIAAHVQALRGVLEDIEGEHRELRRGRDNGLRESIRELGRRVERLELDLQRHERPRKRARVAPGSVEVARGVSFGAPFRAPSSFYVRECSPDKPGGTDD